MKTRKFFRIGAVLLLAALSSLSCRAKEARRESSPSVPQEKESVMVMPGFLKPGDKVAIITPSYATDSDKIAGASQIIRSWGYEPVIGPNVGKRFAGDFAGTAEERLSDLRWALNEPEIKAIICQRGGYGTLHFVGDLMPGEFAANPKWLIGYSDITTLLGMAFRGGVISVHGPMGNYMTYYNGLDSSCLLLRDLLAGNIPSYRFPSHCSNISGRATGRLAGGNICTMAPVAGTDADFTAEGDLILFIEEVEENYHNLDRQLNILLKHGLMERIKGVILGDFTECKADLDYPSPEEVIISYFKGKGIPVACGFPAGHGDANWPLLIGAEATLTVTPEGSTLVFNL